MVTYKIIKQNVQRRHEISNVSETGCSTRSAKILLYFYFENPHEHVILVRYRLSTLLHCLALIWLILSFDIGRSWIAQMVSIPLADSVALLD